MDIKDNGENCVTEYDKMLNIQGAYCLPEYRGKGVYRDLLEYVIEKLQDEGYTLLGVDHEPFSSTANRFWRKYFLPYTCSVVRRIDDCAFKKTTLKGAMFPKITVDMFLWMLQMISNLSRDGSIDKEEVLF